MLQIVRYLPAWLLKLLPARVARRCVIDCSSTTTLPSESVRQLLVDVSVIYQSDARTGIQRVVRSLLLQLLDAQPIGFQVRPVFATRQNGYCYADPNFLDPSALPSKDAAKAVQVFHNDLFLGLDLAAHLLPHHQAQVLSWKRSGVKVHVVVYDLLPLQYPKWFNPKTTRNFKRWIRWLAVYADGMVCISETVKTEVASWLSAEFGLADDSVPARTIMLGADISASAPSLGRPPSADIMLARMRSTPSALMVGTVEPRKGYDQALAAFELIWQRTNYTSPLLVVVGKPGWKTEDIQERIRSHHRFGETLFWLEDASDELLEHLYEATRCVLVASRAEGFGLPVVEAALYGKPVLARDIAVFRELSLPNISFFRGNTSECLAKELEELLTQPSNAVKPMNRSAFHSWNAAGKQLFSILDIFLTSGAPLDATMTEFPTDYLHPVNKSDEHLNIHALLENVTAMPDSQLLSQKFIY
jgi:glycosyltransferase involved in cell wall biosynthesis